MKGSITIDQKTMQALLQSGMSSLFYPSALPVVDYVYQDDDGYFVVQVRPQPKKAK